MGFKVIHYAAKIVKPNPQMSIETIVLELSIGAILMVMAIGGFKTGLLLMAIPCGLVSLACFLSVIFSIWHFIVARKTSDKSADDSI